MNNKKEKSLLSRFFSHNITLLVMAFLIAVSAWFIINLSSNSENRTASVDVPIIVELPEDAQKEELKLFGADGLSATVVVKGNLMATSTVTSNDIQAVATQNASLLSPGYHNLPIVAKQTGIKSNYTIDSVTPSNITVYVDREKQAEFTIDNQITVEHDDEKNNYANAALSQSKVIVTGPETEVNEIKTVAVIDTLTEDVTSKEEKLTFLDQDGNDLYLEYCSCDVDSIEVSVTVLPIKTVSLSVDTSNAPSDNPKIEINPSTIRVAGPQETLDKIKDSKLTIGTLDFTKYKNESVTEKFDITLPSGCKVVSGETSATITTDLTSYQSTTISAKVSNIIDTTKYTTEMVSSNAVDITVCGPEDLINSISASDITATTDYTGLLDDAKAGKTMSLTVPLKISYGSDYAECWIYGTYTVNVNVTKK